MLKDEFMKIKTYEEFDRQRDKFSKLDFSDEDVKEHYKNIFLNAGVRVNVKAAKEGTILDYF